MSSSERTGRTIIAAICRRLSRVYGPVEPPPQLPVLEELIAAILSQNTSDANSDAALARLKQRFPDWDALAAAPLEAIKAAIRPAGLANRKAPRIKAIVEQIRSRHGTASLEFLHQYPTQAAVQYLSQFPGVGPKTVACVLLFACRKPVLPVDTHVHRVAGRLGLIAPGTSAEKAHRELARLVPPSRVLEFHIQLIRHGRSTCRARRPNCHDCPLLELCPTGRKQTGTMLRPHR